MSDTVISDHETSHGSYTSYTVGFILSIVLTVTAYLFVTKQVFTRWSLLFALVGLAIVQLFVQAIFFLHIARRSKPRWNLFVFLFMLLIVLIVVVGSLWIMYNMNYRMVPMSEQKTNQYIYSQDGL